MSNATIETTKAISWANETIERYKAMLADMDYSAELIEAQYEAATLLLASLKDAYRYRRLKSFALPRYIVRTRMGDSVSLYKEQDAIIWLESWDAMDAALDMPVIETTSSEEK